MNATFEAKVEYPILTKVTGTLDYMSLKIIKDELKANAASINSDLGGGTHGHLGLVMDPIEYALISNVPYDRLTQPPPLIIAPGTTQYNATREREDHKEAVRLYREMIALEKYLTKLISHAIPSTFLKSFRNRSSNAITTTIPIILSALFQTYGLIPEEELLTKENNLRAKVFDIVEPLIILYNEVEDLQELAVAAQNPYSDPQIINLGIKLIKNMCDFEKGLTTWYDLPLADQTWIRFKTHFNTAQNSLRRVRGPTMQSGILSQQANILSTKIMSEIQHERTEYLNAVSASEARILHALDSSTPPIIEEPSTITTPTQQSLNATTSDTVVLEVLKLLKEIKDDMRQSKTNNNNRNNNNNNSRRNNNNNNNNDRSQNNNNNRRQHNNNRNNNNRNNNNNNRRSGNADENPRQTQQFRYNTSKYCFSCGGGNHIGKYCDFKKPGHKNNATFKDKMGGCTDFCQQV